MEKTLSKMMLEAAELYAKIGRCERLSCNACARLELYETVSKIEKRLVDWDYLCLAVTFILKAVAFDALSVNRVFGIVRQFQDLDKAFEAQLGVIGHFLALECAGMRRGKNKQQSVSFHVHALLMVDPRIWSNDTINELKPSSTVNRPCCKECYDKHRWLRYASKGPLKNRGWQPATRQRLVEVLDELKDQHGITKLFWHGGFFNGHNARWPHSACEKRAAVLGERDYWFNVRKQIENLERRFPHVARHRHHYDFFAGRRTFRPTLLRRSSRTIHRRDSGPGQSEVAS